MFLLFRVGLEVKVQELFSVGRTALTVAIGGVLLPFACGWGIMAAFGMPRLQGIFIGTAMVATSVGITAQVLSARRVLWHRSSQTILAAAVIDDVLGLLVLALITGFAKSEVNVKDIAMTTVLTTAFVGLMGYYGTKAIRHLAPVEKKMRLVGVAGIVGAFLAGMAFSDSAGQRLRDLTSGATELLLPFFLVGIGLHVELGGLREPGMLAMGGALLVAAILSKLIGCGLGAFGESFKDRIRIGVGMMPRGEVGMVVAQLGLTMGVLTQPLYGILVAVCVATTIVAPPLLAYCYRDVAAEGEDREFPSMR